MVTFRELYDADGNLLWKKGKKSVLTYQEAREVMRGETGSIKKGGQSYRGPFKTASAKYDGIDFKPPAGAAKAAQKAINWKKEHGNAVKGGTAVGWTRASQLVKGDPLSPETVKRMHKFFLRHQKNKAVKPEFKSEPWRDNGYIAWLIWGGDAGRSWAETKWNQMERADAKTAKDGLWDNIRKKKERGEKPAKPGDEDYPDEETWEELTANLQPLRNKPDYGEKGHRPQDYTEAELIEMARKLTKEAAELVNPYLNTPPTKLRRDLESEKDDKKRKQMKDALNAWRITVPGPFWRTQAARELLAMAKAVLGYN
jgi:hypothetical protein